MAQGTGKVQGNTGAVVSGGDFVKIPNPNAAVPGAQNAYFIGVYLGPVSPGIVAVNVPNSDGTCTIYRNVKAADMVELISLTGPGNSVSNK